MQTVSSSSSSTLSDDLDIATMLAALGERIACEHLGSDAIEVASKSDGSPVSNADRAVEAALRRQLERWLPQDGILGEELGERRGDSGRRWIIDPIDGTSNYVKGSPHWAVQIALEQAGRIEVGIVAAPMLGVRWWAVRGGGAFRNGARIETRTVLALDQAVVTQRALESADAGLLPEPLARQLHHGGGVAPRSSFWSELLVAEGVADIDACHSARIWDLAPRQIIVEEAGGCFGDLGGRHRSDSGTSLSCASSILYRTLVQREAVALAS